MITYKNYQVIRVINDKIKGIGFLIEYPDCSHSYLYPKIKDLLKYVDIK